MTAKPLKLSTKVTDPLIGQQLGDYSIVSLLGRGGMARVYKGFDASLERYAAVKVIDAQLATGSDAPEYRERFHREARSIARLRHPNIVSVYQFGEFKNLYYMAMMFIEGHDLTQILRDHAQRRSRMSYGTILQIARDMGAALDYAHREGVIHRDIKPSNIMVTGDGHAILTDFGLALSVPEGSIGNTFGSAHYIAPEQAVASNNAVPQSDLYSLAVVIYQMLAGRVPFDDPSAMSVAIKHLQEPPPPPSLINRELNEAVDAVLLKALHKSPEKRFPSGGALAQALDKALQASGRSTTIEPLHAIPDAPIEDVSPSVARFDGMTLPLAPEQNPTAVLPPLHKVAPEVAKSFPRPPTSPTRPEIKPLTQPRPAVAPVWAQDLAGDLGSLPRLPTSKPRRRPLVLAAAFGLVVLVGAGIVLLTSGGAADSSIGPVDATLTMNLGATQAATAPDASAAAATLEPTQPSTESTPQDAAQNLTSDSTALATALLAAVSAGEPDVLLRYDRDVLTMVNVGDRTIDLTNLEFAQSLEDGTERIFLANQWGSSGFNVARFDPGECVQVFTDAYINRQSPRDCQREAWRSVSRPRWFWIASGSTEVFVVRMAQAVVATCELASESCEFAFSSPQAR